MCVCVGVCVYDCVGAYVHVCVCLCVCVCVCFSPLEEAILCVEAIEIALGLNNFLYLPMPFIVAIFGSNCRFTATPFANFQYVFV